MNLQKKSNLFKNILLNHIKKFQIFRSLSGNYSNCHPKYGEFNDKENIN